MNQTLVLAEKILKVLQESNQTVESQLTASEIVVNLFKADPYGSLAQISFSGESIVSASPFPRTNSTLGLTVRDQSPCTEDTERQVEPP